MKKAIISIIIIIFVVLVVPFAINNILANKHYEDNLLQWNAIKEDVLNENELISRQTLVENISYGFGNIEDNGCGAVAVYNLFKLAQKDANFVEIVKQFEKYGTNFFGKLGTDPFYFKSFLKQNGFDVKTYFAKSKFAEIGYQSDAVVVVYAGLSGGHYQLMYHTTGSLFQCINPNGSISMENYIGELKNNFVFMFAINY